jgi:hypothetical protein
MEQDGIGTGIGFRDLLRSFRRVLRIHSIFSLYYKKMTPEFTFLDARVVRSDPWCGHGDGT